MNNILHIGELIILLLIAKHLLIYDRYRISISIRNRCIRVLKWHYHDQQYYTHKYIRLNKFRKK